MNKKLLPYPDALRKLERTIQPVEPLYLSWRQTLGAALAEDVTAQEDMPSFDNSAMDGFAVRAEDVRDAAPDHPVSLRITDELYAGSPPSEKTVETGCAAKIMTGAPVPPGADSVLIAEKTKLKGKQVQALAPVSAGKNIRRQGEEIQQGGVFLEEGTKIGPVERGMLASQGIRHVYVRPLPKVSFFTPGDELAEPEQTLAPGQIRNTNTYTLMAELERFGCTVNNLGIVKDDRKAIQNHIEKALSESNMLITIGGVSTGDKDYIPSILTTMGMKTIFHKLNVKPGKPVLFGVLDGAYIFGLPGNVVSVLSSYHLFVKPALRLMTGRKDWRNPVYYVRMSQLMHNPGPRTFFVRCSLSSTPTGLPLAVPTGPQGSGMLTSLKKADGFAVIPGDLDTVEEFDVVEFIPLNAD